MSSIVRGLLRGAAAGAAGAAAHNAAAGLVVARRAGLRRLRPGTGPAPGGPLAPLGSLAGPVTAVAVGGLAGVLRAAGVRVPTSAGGPLLGAAAAIAGAGTLPGLRAGALTTGPVADRALAAAGYLLFGVTAHATLVAVARVAEQREPARPPAPRVLLRAAALGAASGSRSTVGIAALAATSTADDRGAVVSRLGGTTGTTLSGLSAAGELVGDKLPGTPTRTGLPALIPRAAAGAVAAGAAAGRDGHDPAAPAVVGLVSAVGTAFLAVRARGWAAERFGSDRPGALTEDALAALLGWLGARRPAEGRPGAVDSAEPPHH
jgi:uncharacterized membrane protein